MASKPITLSQPKSNPVATFSIPGGSIQGSNYNPQQTAPSTVVQNPAPVYAYQPAYNPQPTAANPQPAAQVMPSAAQIAAQAEIMRQQAAAAAAAAREALRVQVQGQVDSKKQNVLAQIKIQLASSAWKGKLSLSKPQKTPNIILPEQTDYQKAYAKAYGQAINDFNKQRQPGKQNFLQKLGDKVTFGQDRRDVAARNYAQQQAEKIMGADFKAYEEKINSYTKKLATVQAAVNKAVDTMSEAEFDKYLAEQQTAIDNEYNSLVSEGASYDGRQAAFGSSSQQPLTSFASKVLSKGVGAVKAFASDKNPIWRGTLGGGWENVPSLVTAPGRVVNWAGNINTKDRTIYQYGGTSFDRSKSGKNAWQASFNQRNVNLKPYVDRPFDAAEAKKMFENKSLVAPQPSPDVVKKYNDAKTEVEKQKILRQAWDDNNKYSRFFNSAAEIGLDPLIGVGAAAKGVKFGAKALGLTDKLSEAARTSKLTGWTFKAADKATAFKTALAETKTAKWLLAEHKTPGQTFADTQQAVRDLSRAQQDVLLKKMQTITEKLKANPEYDLSIFDVLKNLSPKEREVLQRMTGDGKFALRDRLFLVGKNNAAARSKLEAVAKQYTDFTEKMKLSDQVKTTRFGLGKNRVYSPKTAWADHLDNYNFRLFKKGRQVQNGEDFLHGVIDRFFKSNLDQTMVKQGKNASRLKKEFGAVSGEYRQSFDASKAAIAAARSKLNHDTTGVVRWMRNKNGVRSDVSFGRSIFNTAKNVQAAPTQLWKKSVLKYRPAWYVNNELYNTQAAVLAGGWGSLAEKVKMVVSPRYWRKAMQEGSAFRSNIGKEIGHNRFASNQEDWSRVAAGRAAMKKGFTEAQATKRVNKYLFDYKTSNWERPIKAVLPFWAFQKNLGKAAAAMPFDRPGAAIAYNRLDRYQQTQYDQEFAKMVPELTKLGYTAEEISAMKEQNAKYFRGRLKIGSHWITTPFNAFSDKGMTNLGINPFLAAGQEVADSVDSFGQKVKGKESGFLRRILSKFPQAELGRQMWQSHQVNAGKLLPSEKYIGKSGGEGYGLGKEKQGYDPKKPNYVASMDPRRKLGANLLAFAGVPKTMTFDQKGFVKGKMLQKLSGDYFALDTKNMTYDNAEVARQAIFKKYGVTADEFYKGILSKYDTANTTRIKQLKEDAKAANDSLFAEYEKQSVGTRGAWAIQKLAEMNKAGYFGDNPFKYSFVKTLDNPKGWITPDAIQRVKTGQAKKADYQYAVATGDWTKYREKYGSTGKQSPFQYAGKFFKTAESMAKYKEGEFWGKYASATLSERKKLLVDNPQFNTRSGWTASQWTSWKQTEKDKLKKRATGFGNISSFIAQNKSVAEAKSLKFRSTLNKRVKKVAWKLS